MSVAEPEPSQLILPDQSVVLLIDVQEDWGDIIDPEVRGKLVFEVERMLKFADLAGIPIVWAEAAGLGCTCRSIRELLRGQEPVVKSSFSCLGDERLSSAISDLGRDG